MLRALPLPAARRARVQTVRAAQGCSLLIHEATFEDDMAEDARKKKHSTTGQALSIAEQVRGRSALDASLPARAPAATQWPPRPPRRCLLSPQAHQGAHTDAHLRARALPRAPARRPARTACCSRTSPRATPRCRSSTCTRTPTCPWPWTSCRSTWQVRGPKAACGLKQRVATQWPAPGQQRSALRGGTTAAMRARPPLAAMRARTPLLPPLLRRADLQWLPAVTPALAALFKSEEVEWEHEDEEAPARALA